MKRIRAVAMIVNNEKILLMHRINNGKEYYVFPGGGVENIERLLSKQFYGKYKKKHRLKQR